MLRKTGQPRDRHGGTRLASMRPEQRCSGKRSKFMYVMPFSFCFNEAGAAMLRKTYVNASIELWAQELR